MIPCPVHGHSRCVLNGGDDPPSQYFRFDKFHACLHFRVSEARLPQDRGTRREAPKQSMLSREEKPNPKWGVEFGDEVGWTTRGLGNKKYSSIFWLLDNALCAAQPGDLSNCLAESLLPTLSELLLVKDDAGLVHSLVGEPPKSKSSYRRLFGRRPMGYRHHPGPQRSVCICRRRIG